MSEETKSPIKSSDLLDISSSELEIYQLQKLQQEDKFNQEIADLLKDKKCDF